MTRFGYWRDQLCCLSCAAYATNRWLVKPHCHWPFFHSYFNDLLLIPAALPLVLWLQRRLGWRNHDGFPTATELLSHLLLWSVLFEWVGPHWMKVTGDPMDAVTYAAGGGVAALWWRSRERNPTGGSWEHFTPLPFGWPQAQWSRPHEL